MAGWVDVVDKGITAGAALVGVAAGYFGQRLTSKAAHDREEAGRTAERELRFADYQRTTLHDLQEALVELLRSTFAAAFPEVVEVPADQNFRRFEASSRVTMLTQRVRDPGVREAVDRAASRLEEVFTLKERSVENIRAARTAQDEAQAAIGVVLRSLP